MPYTEAIHFFFLKERFDFYSPYKIFDNYVGVTEMHYQRPEGQKLEGIWAVEMQGQDLKSQRDQNQGLNKRIK